MVHVFVSTLVVTWCLLVCGRTHLIDCTIDQCQNAIINCKSNESCVVSCSDSQSCSGSLINCPETGDCDIHCIGKYSCRYTIINATLSIGNLNILCEHSTDHCKKMQIYGSILDTNTGGFNLSCNGKSSSCTNSEINCPTTSNCSIACNADTSCQHTTIHGPHHGNFDAHCNGDKSCTGTVYNGSTSSLLTISGCIEQESCLHLSLYCPPNTEGIKHCFIEGNVVNEWNIYAVHGWDDIEMDTMDINEDITMFCGDNYDASCDGALDMNIAPDSMSTVKKTNHISSESTGWRPSVSRILFGVCVIVMIIIVGVYCLYKKRHKCEEKVSKKDWFRVQSESIADHELTVNDTEYEIRNVVCHTLDTECESMDKECENTLDGYHLATKARKSIVFKSEQDDCVQNIQDFDTAEINPPNTDVITRKDPSNMSSYIMEWQQENNDDEDNMMIITGNTINNIITLYSSNDDDDEYDFLSESNDSLTLSRKRVSSPMNNIISPLNHSLCHGYAMAKMEESETDVSSESLVESNNEMEVTPSIRSNASGIDAESFCPSFDPAPTAC